MILILTKRLRLRRRLRREILHSWSSRPALNFLILWSPADHRFARTGRRRLRRPGPAPAGLRVTKHTPRVATPHASPISYFGPTDGSTVGGLQARRQAPAVWADPGARPKRCACRQSGQGCIICSVRCACRAGCDTGLTVSFGPLARSLQVHNAAYNSNLEILDLLVRRNNTSHPPPKHLCGLRSSNLRLKFTCVSKFLKQLRLKQLQLAFKFCATKTCTTKLSFRGCPSLFRTALSLPELLPLCGSCEVAIFHRVHQSSVGIAGVYNSMLRFVALN